MLIPNTTNLTASTISDADINTTVIHQITATVRREGLLVTDLQKILREVPSQYQVTSIQFESTRADGNPAVIVNITCNDCKTLKQDTTIPTPRYPGFDGHLPPARGGTRDPDLVGDVPIQLCSDDSPVPVSYRREEGMTVSKGSTIV